MTDERFSHLAHEGFDAVFAAAGPGPDWDELIIAPPAPRRISGPFVALAGAAFVAVGAVVIAVLLASGLGAEDPQPPVDTTDPSPTTTLDAAPTTTTPDATTTTVPVIPIEPVTGGSVTVALDGDLVNGFTGVDSTLYTGNHVGWQFFTAIHHRFQTFHSCLSITAAA